MALKLPQHLSLPSLLLLAVVLSGCSRDDKLKGHDYGPIATLDSCFAYSFEIAALPYDSLPYTGFGVSHGYDTSFVRDSDGVMLTEVEGRTFYHPAALAFRMFKLLDVYRQTGDSSLLKLAVKYADRLAGLAVRYDSALYFAYQIDYKVHQRDDAELKAPWFSGFAQGEVLKAFTRLFVATADSSYLELADKTFNSFLRLRGEAKPWTVFVDSLGCFWVEEYPLDEPTMTLNGFIFAILGLYEYCQVTGNARAESILQACLSTVKNHLPLFRRVGRPSFYNLRFRHYDSEYHLNHIILLAHLARMSGDSFFSAWADSLRLDYQRPS